MPSFRALTMKIRTAISPSSSTTPSPSTSPVSSQSSNASFQVISGRKQSSFAVVSRSDSYPRLDSMTTLDSSDSGKDSAPSGSEIIKQRRLSRFREELHFDQA